MKILQLNIIHPNPLKQLRSLSLILKSSSPMFAIFEVLIIKSEQVSTPSSNSDSTMQISCAPAGVLNKFTCPIICWQKPYERQMEFQRNIKFLWIYLELIKNYQMRNSLKCLCNHNEAKFYNSWHFLTNINLHIKRHYL